MLKNYKKLKRSVLSLFLVMALSLVAFATAASAADISYVDEYVDSSGKTISISTGQFYQWGCSVSIESQASSWISSSRPNLYYYDIVIAPNTTGANRVGTVTVSGPSGPNGGTKQIVYTITQGAGIVRSFSRNGGTLSVSTGQFYQWGCSVSIESQASSWISSSRPNLYYYDIVIAPNTTGANRVGTVTVSGPSDPNGGTKKIIYTITQEL